MPTRFAACEPCRISKVICDHERPICGRCHERKKATECKYRDRPFKRKRNLRKDHPWPTALGRTAVPVEQSDTNTRVYPNPGYLGNSSHTTIYEQLHLSETSEKADLGASKPDSTASAKPISESQNIRGVGLLEDIKSSLQIADCHSLVDCWLTEGRNLSLAGSFTKSCADAALELFNHVPVDTTRTSKDLFKRSYDRLIYDAESSLEDYSSNFAGSNARWETLGLFFAIVSRAATDIPLFRPLYDSKEGQRKLQRQSMHLADDCLETALSLDCLNDLQLFLQYENFIVHSIVDGDQSYHSWRKLGDVVSSLFALGYHERIDDSDDVPVALQDLRKAAFARAYSADKNISIFLGRPPRLHSSYCRFWLSDGGLENWHKRESAMQLVFSDVATAPFDYRADTYWSVMCAKLKERVLDLPKIEQHDDRIKQASNIQTQAEKQWSTLPPRYRLESALKLDGSQAIERDFMVSARLNHLHVLFLLRLALTRRTSDLDLELISLSASMLSLAVQSMLLKDYLVSSGTGIVWRVIYYGLPAAGIVCLTQLNHPAAIAASGLSWQKVIQDLSVLVAQVESGSFMHSEEPNFALLTGAAKTIQSVLTRVLSTDMKQPTTHPAEQSGPGTIEEDPSWTMWDVNQDTQDFDLDFWLQLGEHPALTGDFHQELDSL